MAIHIIVSYDRAYAAHEVGEGRNRRPGNNVVSFPIIYTVSHN
jgi:hypothetical protein